jgi:hypothetical protein
MKPIPTQAPPKMAQLARKKLDGLATRSAVETVAKMAGRRMKASWS